MAKDSFQQELEQKAARAILQRSVYRWESAAIIALTLVLFALVPRPLPFWQRWYWLILGFLGEIGLVWSSLTDPEFRARAVAEMFHERFQVNEIADRGLRERVQKALEYRDRIDVAIRKSREGVLRDHLADLGQGTTAWMESLFHLARRLDEYQADEMIQQDLKAVGPAIEQLKARLALEDDETVKRQISQAIAQRQIQRDNLRKLQNVMQRAEFQLEGTLTAMGTVYSQIMILEARDVSSGRAQRLQQEVAEQVQALQDVVTTMDEVYRASVDPAALGLEVAVSGAMDAAGGRKRGQAGSVNP